MLKIRRHIRILLSMVLLSIIHAFALKGQESFTDQNLVLQYFPDSNIPVQYQVVRGDTSFTILLEINFPEVENISETFHLIYEVKSSYEQKKSLFSRTFNHHLRGIGELENKKYYRLEIPDNPGHNLVFIIIRNRLSGINFIQDIPLRQPFLYPHPDFSVNRVNPDLPLCKTYVSPGDTLLITDHNPRVEEYFIYHYRHDFSAADPPMYRLDREVSPSLDVDTLYRIDKNEPFIPDAKGLYFIQSDTNTLSGFAFRCEERFFPRIARIENLTGPVVYLSTKQEMNELREAENTRNAFEKFWLNMAANEQQASWIIKKYFDQVEKANLFFTNYKEGWKTDRGMIYIIFGLPDEISSTGDSEAWTYRNLSSPETVVFNFIRLKNPFSNDHFMLIRDNQYKNIWFRAIDEWRKGRK